MFLETNMFLVIKFRMDKSCFEGHGRSGAMSFEDLVAQYDDHATATSHRRDNSCQV